MLKTHTKKKKVHHTQVFSRQIYTYKIIVISGLCAFKLHFAYARKHELRSREKETQVRAQQSSACLIYYILCVH